MTTQKWGIVDPIVEEDPRYMEDAAAEIAELQAMIQPQPMIQQELSDT